MATGGVAVGGVAMGRLILAVRLLQVYDQPAQGSWA